MKYLLTSLQPEDRHRIGMAEASHSHRTPFNCPEKSGRVYIQDLPIALEYRQHFHGMHSLQPDSKKRNWVDFTTTRKTGRIF